MVAHSYSSRLEDNWIWRSHLVADLSSCLLYYYKYHIYLIGLHKHMSGCFQVTRPTAPANALTPALWLKYRIKYRIFYIPRRHIQRQPMESDDWQLKGVAESCNTSMTLQKEPLEGSPSLVIAGVCKAVCCVGAVNDGFLVQPWVTGVEPLYPTLFWALLRLTISRKRGLCSVFITAVPMSDERSGNCCCLCMFSERQSIKAQSWVSYSL